MLWQAVCDSKPRCFVAHMDVHFRPRTGIVVEAPRRQLNPRCARERIWDPRPAATAEAGVISRRSFADRRRVHPYKFLALDECEVFSRDQEACRKRRASNLAATRTMAELKRSMNLACFELHATTEAATANHGMYLNASRDA